MLKLLYTYVKLFFKVLCKLLNFAFWQTYDPCARNRYWASHLPSDFSYLQSEESNHLLIQGVWEGELL